MCAAVALLMVAGLGLAQDKGKKTMTVNGKIKKLDAVGGTLTVTVKGKKGEDSKDMEFKVTDETKVVIYADGSDKPSQLTGKAGLKDPQFKEGATVKVATDPNTPDKAVQITIGQAKKPKK
jgi:hypothetical protein